MQYSEMVAAKPVSTDYKLLHEPGQPRSVPAVQLFLHCIQKELADDVRPVGGALLCAMLLFDHVLQFLLVPVIHALLAFAPASTQQPLSNAS